MARRISVAPSRHDRLEHWILLALILIAFGRLVWQLDSKSLWWDESLSLQRAESPWPTLLVGWLGFDDSVTQVFTTDQHPFTFFALLGALVRVAGESEFVLRFPSVLGATLLVPMSWAFAQLLARNRFLPRTTPLWTALFAAVNPFFLWYGREARMYTIVSLLSLLSIYLLMRWREAYPESNARRYLIAYALATALLLSTHYLSVLLLPIHAGLLLSTLWPYNRRGAILTAFGALALGLVFGIVAGAVGLKAPGSGSNFSSVSLSIMTFDLLNAFSLGLSVDVARVRWLDYVFGIVVLVGVLWCWRRPEVRPARCMAVAGFVAFAHYISSSDPAGAACLHECPPHEPGEWSVCAAARRRNCRHLELARLGWRHSCNGATGGHAL